VSAPWTYTKTRALPSAAISAAATRSRNALSAAAAEAELLATDLVVVNLTLGLLEASQVPGRAEVTVVDAASDRDPAEVVLEEIEARDVTRLVIGLKRRSPVGKALLGSVSQRLLLEAPVPVVAVKLPEGR
jgi:nucleotide-binding universal stress UspA family protein